VVNPALSVSTKSDIIIIVQQWR